MNDALKRVAVLIDHARALRKDEFDKARAVARAERELAGE